jgi:hypothetical protein
LQDSGKRQSQKTKTEVFFEQDLQDLQDSGQGFRKKTKAINGEEIIPKTVCGIGRFYMESPETETFNPPPFSALVFQQLSL